MAVYLMHEAAALAFKMHRKEPKTTGGFIREPDSFADIVGT
ncbi:MAG TPA: hypothetical protein VF624_16430 [Tepidisphaeraceae bacterium]|jgi:hypothetical protein